MYERDELFESSHFSRINSIIEKIGDDVKIWEKQGQLGCMSLLQIQNLSDSAMG